jgi:alpha-amylase/alpha-mannosidase (GH57 family)
VDPGAAGFVVIHGHFYQPPRENPWIEEVEMEESAAPYHDWNERVVSECYRPNSCSRIIERDRRILDIVNNYGLMSYDFGPNILGWLARHHPVVYGRILAGDIIGRERLGHGGAMACAYNHAILPLCSARDLETQIVWGKADFRHRFRRQPEAMWLPETAVNGAVLEALVRHGLRYCVLAPTQAEAVRSLAGGEWQDVSSGDIDTTRPYRCWPRPGGPDHIDVFFYNGAVSHAVSFEDILSDARLLIERLEGSLDPAAGGRQLLHVAVDGETFGHHRPLGNMALAYALKVAAPQAGLAVTNYSAYLEGHPPAAEVRLKAGPDGLGTAWSCAHGLGRWQRDCGCTTGSRPGWNQAWRTPLREALDLLRDRLAPFFEEEAGGLLNDPWAARDAYIEVILDRSPEGRERFFERFGRTDIGQAGRVRALRLLEMQRHCLLMYTSCGWFFADISGLEAVQVLRYAARALELAAQLGLDVEADFLAVLGRARSNLPEMGDGRRIFERLVRPAMVSQERVVNHFAIGSMFTAEVAQLEEIFHYRVRVLDYEKRQRGAIVLAAGVVELTSGVIPEPRRYVFAMTFLGGYFFRTGVQETALERADELKERLFQSLDERPGDVIGLVQELFPDHYYSLRDVFKEQKTHILKALIGQELEDYYRAFNHVFETTKDAMEEMTREGLTVPEEFQMAAEKTLGRRLAEEVALIGDRPLQESKIIESEIRAIVDQARLFGLRLDSSAVRRRLSRALLEAVDAIVSRPGLERVAQAGYVLGFTASIDLELDLAESQNMLHAFLARRFGRLAAEAHRGEPEAAALAEALLGLAEDMGFNVAAYERLLREGAHAA